MRLIDIEAEVCADCVCRDKCDRQAYCWAKEMQTVDAVPVVRCRECSKWQKKETTWLCRGFGYCTECMMGCHADNYCSYGERKEGAD